MSPPKPLYQTARFKVVEIEHRGQTKVRVEHPGAVAILPFVDDSRICLIRNERFAVNETLIEIPAGTREPNEPPEVTAERELAEETGYHGGKLVKLLDYYVSPGILNEKMHVYVATGMKPGPQSLEADEKIENEIVDFDVALQWIQSGKICDAKTIASILFYQHLTSSTKK